MQEVLRELERLRKRTRTMLIVQRLCALAGAVIAAVFAAVLLDYSLRLPAGIRLVLLALGGAGLIAAVWRSLLPAIGYHPSLTQLALRVESVLPSVTGRLASSVEFVLAGADLENPLAARSVREAQRRLAAGSVTAVIQPRRLIRDVAIFLVVTSIAGGLAVAASDTAAMGLKRLFLPYGSAQWPARTAVASLMNEVLDGAAVHPRGQVLVLRARNRTAGEPDGRVDVHYRLRRGGVFGDWQPVVLTHQGAGVHERLVDTNAERIELYFATEDARTKVETIELVPPPAVLRATLSVTPPAYAKNRAPELAVELGPGLDQRAVTETAGLVGSEVGFVLELNKALPVPPAGFLREQWLRRTLGWPVEEPLPTFDVLDDVDEAADADDGRRWGLSWSLRSTRTLDLALVDEHGLENAEPIRYRIEAAADLPPSVTITEPDADLAVLPTAVVPVVAEAKDDVAVARVGLSALRRRGDDETALEFGPVREIEAPIADLAVEIDLARFDLVEGDVVILHAVADDVFDMDGARHDTVTSPPRRLRLISELDFAAQLRRQLSSVRQNAIRVESLQAELQDDIEEHGMQPGLRRAQAQLGTRIAAQRDMVDDLQEQVAQNRLEDEQLAELLQQSRDLLDYAGRAANEAVDAIEQAEQAQQAARAEPAEEAPASDEDIERAIDEAQQEVRDELGDLIELLDRDEDTWIVQRQLESLIEEQLRLEAATAQLGEQTIGQSLDSLRPEQLSELDRIAQRQRELRDEARRLIEEMRRRAESLEEMDPQSASGMRSAADTGERREVDRDMQTAASRAEQNQLQSAVAAQQAAAQSLQQMNQDLQETRRARAEELLRQLASLIESIERLITVQENELIALAVAEAKDGYSGRDRAMIRLVQNTQSVAVEARGAGQESRRIARTLDRAADAQGAAVSALRTPPIDSAAVREAEERSLAALKEAQTLAKELEQKTQDDQTQKRRQELIEAYRALAEKQVAVRDETLALAEAAGDELTRRQLVEARRIGNAQHEIRLALQDVEGRTQEVLESDVFRYVHRLIDDWSAVVSDALWEGAVDVDVTDRQRMIADSIMRQIEALEEASAPPDEFEEEQGAAGGAGSAGTPPLIPPMAEVRRLHGLQEQVYNQTRQMDRRDDLDAGQRRRRLRELGTMQRELVEIGQKMLEKLEEAAGGAAPPPDDPQ